MLSDKKQVIYSNIQKSYSHSPLLSVKKKLLENESLNASENIRIGSPIEPRNVKISNPIKELKKLENELIRLREENELIKFNNIQYCKQINVKNGKLYLHIQNNEKIVYIYKNIKDGSGKYCN